MNCGNFLLSFVCAVEICCNWIKWNKIILYLHAITREEGLNIHLTQMHLFVAFVLVKRLAMLRTLMLIEIIFLMNRTHQSINFIHFISRKHWNGCSGHIWLNSSSFSIESRSQTKHFKKDEKLDWISRQQMSLIIVTV